jgi:hypothetical protein
MMSIFVALARVPELHHAVEAVDRRVRVRHPTPVHT